MRLTGWLNYLHRPSKRSPSGRRDLRQRKARYRPQLEPLEDRTLLSVKLVANFKGLDTNAAGGIVEPPDTIAAAGPTAIVEIVNSNLAYYDKTGKQLFTEDLGTFFAPVDSARFLFSDVYVTYDELAGRFFVSTEDVDFMNLQSYFDFAVSNDSNPLDGFTEMHQINTTEISPRTGETLFTDFPRLGWNADAYVISFNMFGFQTEYPYNVQVLTIDKASVLDKNNATLTTYQVDRPAPNATLVPATMHGATAGGPLWFVEEKGLEQNGQYLSLRVVKETNVLSATPTFTDYYVQVAPYTITPFPGDTLGQVSTALDTRILSVDWRSSQMVVCQDVGIATDTDVHARWYELSTSFKAPSLLQQGTLAPGPGIDTYMPSAALGTDGSIGLTYIESSATENMSMYVTGRLPTDSSGTMQTGVLVKAGEQYYQGTRVGDFSGITVDPTSGTTYWAANEYAISTTDLSLPNWGTWIGEFTLTKTLPPPSPNILAGASNRPSRARGSNHAGTAQGISSMVDGKLATNQSRPLIVHPRAQGHPSSGPGNPGSNGKPGGMPMVVSQTTNFKGLDTNAAGGIVEPPDTIAAAGPNHIVEIVNSNLAYYDKTGKQLFTEDLGSFFAPVDSVKSLFSDVYVTYDDLAGRFFVSTMDIDFFNLQSYFDFAVSNDSNPLDGFTEMHQVNTTEVSSRTGETLFTDFPRLGWNADAYVITFNTFGFLTQYPYNVQILTINKASVLDKNNATLTTYQVDRPAPNASMVPATMHGATAGGPLWFVEEKGLEQNGQYLDLRVVKETNVLSTTPTFTDYYVAVAPYTITPFPGDTLGQVSFVLDTRMLSVDWRSNQMVVAQDQGIASDTDVHAGWYLLSTSGTSPTLVQQGALAPGAGVDTYMPSAALGTDGSIGMTYIESSPTENMSMYVTGRLASDPVGTMQKGVLIKAGEQYYQGTRIGDFSGTVVDPTNGATYWAANEYAISTSDISLPNWGTWIAKFTISSPIATWTGGGTTTNWSDPNNWSGGVTPSAGSTLIFGPTAVQFTSTDDLAAGTSFNLISLTGGGYFISGNAITLSGGIDASSSTSSNTFNLNVTLSQNEAFNAGSGTAALTLGGTIADGGFTLTIGGGNGPITFANVISGAGGFTQSNTGTVTFSGPANTYTGSTSVLSGVLVLDKAGGNAILGSLIVGPGAATVQLAASNQIADTAAVTVNSSALLDFNNNSDTIGVLTLSAGTVTTETGTVTLNGNVTASGASSISGNLSLGTATWSFTVNAAATLTVSAVISGSGGLTKAGAGTLVLTGSNMYSGTTTHSSGTLTVGNNSALGTGMFALNGGTLSASGSPISLANAVTLGGNVMIGGSVSLTFTGAVTLTGSRTLTVTSTGTTTMAGVIGESGGSNSLTKTGSALLVLSSGNSYSGGTTLSSGTLAVGNNSALGTGTLTLAGGTLTPTGGPITLANAVTVAGSVMIGGSVSLTFTGAVTLTGSRTLTVNNTAATTLAGAVGESGGSGSLTKAGAGALVLGGANTYSGGTTLSSGTLTVGTNTALGTGTFTANGGTLTATDGPVSLANALTLGGNLMIGGSVSLTFTGAVTLTGNRTLTVTSSGTTTVAGVIGESGGSESLNKAGSGTLVLSGANTYSGGTVLSNGGLLVGNNSALGTGPLTLSSGTLSTNGTAISLANTVMLAGNVTFGGSADLTLTGAVTITGSRTLNVTNTGTTTIAGAIGQAGGTFGFNKTGTGLLVLSGTSTYGGSTTVSAGTLQVTGSIASSAVIVQNGATLDGSGTTGAVTVNTGGSLSPGTSATQTGILSTGNLTLSSGSNFNATLNGTTPGTGYDQLSVTGTVNLTGSVLNLSLGFTPVIGTAFTLIKNNGAGAVVGTFKGLPQNATFTVNGMTFQISYTGGAGHDVVVTRIA